MNIRIASLNMWLGGVLFSSLIKFLEETDADIVFLQEVYNGVNPKLNKQHRSMEVLQAELNYPYSNFCADFLDRDLLPEISERGNAILSKYPIVSSQYIHFNQPYSTTYEDKPGNYGNCPRGLQHVTINLDGEQINCFNVQGPWDLDGDKYSLDRQKMEKAILKLIKNVPYVILAGDTNAKPTNQAIINILKQLKSVANPTLASTFNMRRKDNPGYATAAVDMVLISNDIKLLNYQCPDVDISDHLPLIATLSI